MSLHRNVLSRRLNIEINTKRCIKRNIYILRNRREASKCNSLKKFGAIENNSRRFECRNIAARVHRSEHVTRPWRSDVCERSSDDQRNVAYSTKLDLIDRINRGTIVDNQVAASIYRSRAARSDNRATITTAKTTNRKYRFAVSIDGTEHDRSCQSWPDARTAPNDQRNKNHLRANKWQTRSTDRWLSNRNRSIGLTCSSIVG